MTKNDTPVSHYHPFAKAKVQRRGTRSGAIVLTRDIMEPLNIKPGDYLQPYVELGTKRIVFEPTTPPDGNPETPERKLEASLRKNPFKPNKR